MYRLLRFFLPPAKKQSALTPLLLLPNRKHVPACDLPFARRLWSLRHSKCCLNEQLHHAGASYVSLAPAFYACGKKDGARSRRCSSFQIASTYRLAICLLPGGYGLGGIRNAVWMNSSAMPEQAMYRLLRFFCLRQKKQSALTPLLLLPNRKHVPACDLPFTMRLWSRRHPKRRLDEQPRHAGASYVSLAPAFYACGKKSRVRSRRCSSFQIASTYRLAICLLP